MKRRLFEDLVLSAAGRPARRGFAWPMSVTVHGAVVAGLLALPAFTTDALPDPPPPPPLPMPHVVAVAVISPPPVPRPQPPHRTPRPAENRATAPPAPPQPIDARIIREDDPPEPTDDPGPKGVICIGCVLPPAVPPGSGPGTATGDGTETTTGGSPLPIGGDIHPPTKLRDVRPVYPDLAKTVRAQGRVVVECIIAPDGRVEDVRAVSGHPLLMESALNAVRQWRYTPTKLNGIPVAVVMTVTVNFILQ